LGTWRITTNTDLDLQHLVALSRPVAEGFARVEPRPWDRSAVLLELVGEIGSLAHVVQMLEGFKRGGASTDRLADECCDVIFVALRLAREDGVALPDRLPIPTLDGSRSSALILQMCRDLAAFVEASATPEALTRLLGHAAAIAEGAGVDVAAAYEREMAIAAGFFAACGDAWPNPQPLRRPLATLRLWRLLWHRHSLPRR